MRLNIGSDFIRIPGFVNIDIRAETKPDIVMDMTCMGLKKCCAEEINLGNVLEHLETDDIYKSLKECKRLVSNNGFIFITIPLVDVAEDMFLKDEIDFEVYQRILEGEGDGYNEHKQNFRMGDLEKILDNIKLQHEPLDLKTFPYIVVSDVNDPNPDLYQFGIKAWNEEK